MSFSFMPWFTGDYRRDTQHLSMMEHGAYLLLLAHCWDQKGPLPLDERRIFGICNARSNEEMGAVRNVLTEFFTRMEDGWYNRRIMREIERSEAIIDKKREAGKLGARVTNSLKRKDIPARARHLLGKSSASDEHMPLNPTPTPTPTPTPRKTSANTVEPSFKVRGSRFALTGVPEEWRAWSAEHFRRLDADKIFAGFRDYWIAQPGQKGVKADWFATWRNWLRRDHAQDERKPGEPRHGDKRMTKLGEETYNEHYGVWGS
jgi:uncharacterized protein YdaU (DUF1376 family)